MMGTATHRVIVALLVGLSVLLTGGCTTNGHSNERSPANGAGAVEPPSYTEHIADAGVSFEMVSIPGGLFVMGSPQDESGRREDEGPRHRVAIEPFWIGAHEVTWDEYRQFMREYSLSREQGRGKLWAKEPVPAELAFDAITAPTPMYEFEGTDRWYPGVKSDGRRPAVNVTQFAAKQYTKWLSKKTGHFYRLPTEAEWEYACRAGTSSTFSFGGRGASAGDYAWYIDNAGGTTHRVAQKKPNRWGLYDMHGNAAEWVIDGYDARAYADAPGTAVRSGDAIKWPTQRYGRVVRGGHFDSEPDRLRSAARDESKPAWHRNDYVTNPSSIHWHTDAPFVGFRVVRPVLEPTDPQKQRYWDADHDEIRRGLMREVSVWFVPLK